MPWRQKEENSREIIFFGLMLTEDGPKVLEYNARFGDPEAQVVLPRMKNDIIDVFEACIDGTLDQIDLQFEDNAAVCVVLASDGYPVSYEKGFEIKGLEKLFFIFVLSDTCDILLVLCPQLFPIFSIDGQGVGHQEAGKVSFR